MMKYYLSLILLLCSIPISAEVRLRPADWATPIIGTSLENIYQVDSGVYRSEQPNLSEFTLLTKFGLKEVLNLREFHSDDDETENLNLQLHRIKIDTGEISEQDILQALKIIKQRKGPILVHCWHGSDRTGAVIAAYRIVFNQWTKAKAIDELLAGGYGHHDIIYPNIVKLIKSLNIEKIRLWLGLI
ncbi:Protein tyrosine/serine phosphatase [hydrothermal vent metagenome]|uniref:diphosphoinositol-polyphosphate diphosphatase n=1 Tax=hydrothermal vent metagenome TaxID=652676 RepID=A0A3B0ZBX3_9ZZZZ